MRKIGWFSCGAASAIACYVSKPDVIAYCETGAEHADNARFLEDCQDRLFGRKVIRLRSAQYHDTWDVWEKKRYLAGIRGAPCTGELKIKPRVHFSEPEDVHLFGYTWDQQDRKRAERMEETWPDLECGFPLIDRQIDKAGCLALLMKLGIREPLTYAMGFRNANCLPCVKATSPAYWALVRKEFPAEFSRMVALSRKLKVRLARLHDERVYIDDIPLDHETTDPIVPACDLFCQLASHEKTLAS